MSFGGQHFQGGSTVVLLDTTTITTAAAGVTTAPVTGFFGMKSLLAEGIFVYGSGGTTLKVWVQSSVDGGVTWFDIMNLAFTTASANIAGEVAAELGKTPAAVTDGTLADLGVNQGMLGDRIRLKYTSTGTYAGDTTIKVVAQIKG